VIGLIDTLLHAEGDAVLFTRGEEAITAGKIRATAADAAQRLKAQIGDVVLHTTSASRFVAGLLAATSLGRRIILPAHTQAGYLADIGASPEQILNDDALAFSSEIDARIEITERNPTLVFFTSGSTGAPKPVEKELSHLEIEARALIKLWGADAGFVLSTVSHQHIYGLLYRIMWPVLAGGCSSDEAATYWEEIEHKLDATTTLVTSPAHLSRLPPNLHLADPPKLIFSSGQLLPVADAQACAHAFGRAPLEVFGSTETGGIAWRRQESADAPWTPFENIQISANPDGALEVRSPYLPSDAPYLTGDGVALLPDGAFRLQPRRDRVVKIDGKRVSLARVEEKLAALPEIHAAAALTLPDRKQALAAIVALTDAGRAALQARGAFRLSRDLRRASAAELEPAERPKHWRFVDAIPVDSQGKRVLSTLLAMFALEDVLAPLAVTVRMQTDTEAELAFRLAPELAFFRGHFPEHPILPGVAQAHLAVLFSERLWNFRPEHADLSRVKFRRILKPLDDVVLKLSRDEKRVRFSYHLGDIDVSQGEIGR
jgi:3-hydroxymyristoyl/3-hydroxydecanoyl-(acyl carrier protein) dehydratase